MTAINIFFTVIIALCVFMGTIDANKKLHLSVYYESECSDSANFIIRQLQPTMNKLHRHVDLKLIPFGKASNINQQMFQCQHGPSECRGNIIQDCALDIIQHWSDVDKLAYVACEMETYAAARGNMQCVQSHNIPTSQVQQCANSNYGLSLQLNSEYLTKAVNPKFIPTITINGVFNQKDQDRAQNNLFGTLCPYLTGVRACDNYYSNVALRYQTVG